MLLHLVSSVLEHTIAHFTRPRLSHTSWVVQCTVYNLILHFHTFQLWTTNCRWLLHIYTILRPELVNCIVYITCVYLCSSRFIEVHTFLKPRVGWIDCILYINLNTVIYLIHTLTQMCSCFTHWYGLIHLQLFIKGH